VLDDDLKERDPAAAVRAAKMEKRQAWFVASLLDGIGTIRTSEATADGSWLAGLVLAPH
jgi:hypothetical protein